MIDSRDVTASENSASSQATGSEVLSSIDDNADGSEDSDFDLQLREPEDKRQRKESLRLQVRSVEIDK